MNRKDFQFLAQTRLAEAKALLAAGYPDGAYYLGGYAIECALKACIAKSTRRHDFPDKKNADASHTHNLRDLMGVANLELVCLEETKRDSAFRDNWDLVQQWSEHSRYRKHEPDLALKLLEAIGDRQHGVMIWIKRHW